MEKFLMLNFQIECKREELKRIKIQALQTKSRHHKHDLYKHIKKLETEIGKLKNERKNYLI